MHTILKHGVVNWMEVQKSVESFSVTILEPNG